MEGIHTNSHITAKIKLVLIQVNCTNFMINKAFNKIFPLDEIDHL